MRRCVNRQQEIDKTRGRLVGDFPREAIHKVNTQSQTVELDLQDDSSMSSITMSPL